MHADLMIQMDNAAFQDDDNARIELARILRNLADRIEKQDSLIYLARDINGNHVGQLAIQGE